ncbi:MAG: SPOR domain-containing protein [Sphingomicrobium sp.]
MRKWLFLLPLLAVQPSLLGAQSVDAGVQVWGKGDFGKAVEIWRPLAEGGDVDAQFNLGQAYRLGRGVPVNLAAAQTWLLRAAEKDHLDAQTTLGLLLFDSGNRTGGLRWLRTAAEKGDPRALLVYGTALYNGDDVPRDPVLAYAYVSRAAAQGLAPAKETLAQMDQMIPLAQRKKGVAIALAKAKGKAIAPAKPAASPTTKSVPATTKSTPVAVKSAPVPVKTIPTPVPASAATGNWRVQLGAFSQRASAEALFRKLAAGPLAGRRPFLVPVGAMTRLQAGPYESRAAAAAACASLSARGQACFPVQAK